MSGIYTVYDWHEAHETDHTGLHVPPSPANIMACGSRHAILHIEGVGWRFSLKSVHKYTSTQVHKYTSTQGQEHFRRVVYTHTHTVPAHMTAHEQDHRVLH